MSDGRILQIAPPEALYGQPADPDSCRFSPVA